MTRDVRPPTDTTPPTLDERAALDPLVFALPGASARWDQDPARAIVAAYRMGWRDKGADDTAAQARRDAARRQAPTRTTKETPRA